MKLIFLETTTLIFLAVIFHWFIEYVIKLCCYNDKHQKYKHIWEQTQRTVGKHTTQSLAGDVSGGGVGDKSCRRGTKASRACFPGGVKVSFLWKVDWVEGF